MKRSLYVSLLTIMYFSACQGSEELEQSQEKEYTVSIMARIGKTVSGARYLQDHENAIASFSKTDDIGVFMDNDSAVRWIFDGTSWTTEKSVFWKDKNQEHTFYAYYPHSGSKCNKIAFSRQLTRFIDRILVSLPLDQMIGGYNKNKF